MTGQDAQRLRKLIDVEISNVEADVVNPATNSEFIYQYFPTGYVKSDDWSDLDADDVLRQIKENTEKDNAVRRANGTPLLHVERWMQPPAYNPDTHTVSWIISSDNGGSQEAYAVAL